MDASKIQFDVFFSTMALKCALFIVWYFSGQTLWKESVEVFYWATDDHRERTFLKLLLHAATHKVTNTDGILICAFQNVVN